MMADDTATRDFFVSYNKADAGWAEWIAWVLEREGYTVFIQAWDFPAGTNFVLKMQEAATKARAIIMVLSPSYLGSTFAQPEWAAMFAQDPQGWERKLLPVMVRECAPQGMLAPIVFARLMGRDEPQAVAALLAAVRSERGKPATPPPFPGARTPVSGERPPAFPPETGRVGDRSSPGRITTVREVVPLPWLPFRHSALRRRSVLLGDAGADRPVLEAHLVPSTQLRLEMPGMAGLGEMLIELGRAQGLFELGQAADWGSNLDATWAAGDDPRSGRGLCGIAVTRDGQRSGWMSLPADALGAVFDPVDVRDRLGMLIEVLTDIPIPEVNVAPGAVIDPATALSEADAGVVGRRTRARPPAQVSGGPIVADAECALTLSALRERRHDVAEELTARLRSLLRDRR